jgi:zinc/manganese transport system substrate-binding protein
VMKQEGVKTILIETFYPRSLADILGRETGARVLSLPSDVGANPAIRTYFDLVDAVVGAITAP